VLWKNLSEIHEKYRICFRKKFFKQAFYSVFCLFLLLCSVLLLSSSSTTTMMIEATATFDTNNENNDEFDTGLNLLGSDYEIAGSSSLILLIVYYLDAK